MKAGDVKLLKILDVKYKKSWTDKEERVWHYHNIFLQDKQGNTARKEYYSANEVLPQDLFVIGAWQDIKCLKVDAKADLIEPVMDPEEVKKAERLKLANEIANGKGTSLPKGAAEENTPSKQQCQGNENVRTKTMAMAYAKDLMVVELQTKARGYELSEGDITRMIGWAKRINDAFYEA